MTTFSDLGNNVGFIYITEPNGTTIASNLRNSPAAAGSIKSNVDSPYSGEILARGRITLTGGSGTITNVNINAVNIISATVTGATLTDLANNLRDEINATLSVPDYTAVSDGASVIISSLTGTGSVPNGFIVTASVTGTLTFTKEDMSGGSNPSDTIDTSFGKRYFLNSSPSAVEGDLTGALEITDNVVSRSSTSAFSTKNTGIDLSDAVAVLSRIEKIGIVELNTEGSTATDDCQRISVEGFSQGDIIIINGQNPARVITFKDKTGGNDNLNLANGLDFSTGDKDSVIGFQFQNIGSGEWFEIFRAPDTPISDTSLRNAGISHPVSGFGDIVIPVAGGTVLLDSDSDPGWQRITGSPVLTSSFSIAGTGTPKVGDAFLLHYIATPVTGGIHTITVFGKTLTDTQATGKQLLITATWDGSQYRTRLLRDTFGADLVDQVALDTKENFLGLPAFDGHILASDTAGNRFFVPPVAGLVQDRVVIPSASVLTANFTDVTIVPALGTGIAAIPIAIYVTLDFNTTAYTTNTTLAFRYSGGTDEIAIDTELLKATVKKTGFVILQAVKGGTPSATQVLPNTAILFFVQSGNPVFGNSDVIVDIIYSTITI